MGCALSIQRTCLNPRFSLRTQMFLSFGLTAVIAITTFVLIGLSTIDNGGNTVKGKAREALEGAVRYSLGKSAYYAADAMAKKFANIGGAGSILAEATRDRFTGYRSLEKWEDDYYVPFLDTETGLNKYPIEADPLPLDWNLTGNINSRNHEQHMPYRDFDWYPESADVSSYHAAYFMQGACNPSVTDPNHPEYYPDCTRENNNLFTGGVVQPTETNFYIADKGKDLVWVLKPIYEAQFDVIYTGIFFANDGAGSVIQYPAATFDGRGTFDSGGCEWMNQIHPLTNQPIGTREQIGRCHKAGTTHTMREYNPLEREWCREQVEREIRVLNKKESRDLAQMMSTGPYLDAGAENFWVMSFGQAIFDMLTNEFIGCALLDVSIGPLFDILMSTTVNTDSTHASLESALVRSDEQGSVVVASKFDPDVATKPTNVTDPALDLGVDAATFHRIRNLVDFNTSWWNATTYKTKYETEVFEVGDRLIMAHPVPSIPEKYDELYNPVYFIVLSVDRTEAYGVLDEMDDLIDQDVVISGKNIIMFGGIGFGVILISVAFISFALTKPLRWMQKVSGKIVDNAGGHDLRVGLPDEEDAAEAKPICSPRTEVTMLLSEFVSMIDAFGGEGAADVAGGNVSEVKNKFEWKKHYQELYPWGEVEEEVDPFSTGLNGYDPLAIPKSKTADTYDDEHTVDTQHTERSIFSIISATIPAQYVPAVENAIHKTQSLLTSVKEYAVVAGTRTGLLAVAPEEEVVGPPKVHLGENIKRKPEKMEDYFEGLDAAGNSYLFWWTTFCVGTPILVAAVVISVFVAKDAATNIPIWFEDVRLRTMDIEIDALGSATKLRAALGEEVMHRFARDLHIYTRVAGWLLLGALRRADSITFQATGAEECKYYPYERNETCPFVEDNTLSPCICEWDDPWKLHNQECINETVLATTLGNPFNSIYNTTFIRQHWRYWQHRWYEGLSSNTDKLGNRYSVSDDVAYWANATSWWNSTRIMPGSDRGSSASGYETTYDRVRVLSALSVADFPLYNYHVAIGEEKTLGTYAGLEADGMFTGFSGCQSYAGLAHFRSGHGNSAYEVNSTLCPKDKYGYDARCRSWYPEAFRKGGFAHVTPPYIFASTGDIGMSAGSALIDPQTQERIGVLLVRFYPELFIRAVQNSTAIGQESSTGFPIIITPEPDEENNFDTLVGPNFTSGEKMASIADVVLPYDEVNSTNWRRFQEQVVKGMREGNTSSAKFSRTSKTGEQQEVYITYAPVKLRRLRALDHSDFSAGVDTLKEPVYALGFGIALNDLASAFYDVQNQVDDDRKEATLISIAIIIGALLMVMYMTYTMTIYLAKPILCLVGIVKSISDKTLTDELPLLEGGSCEIHDVYESLEQLCKIVRFSNAAYFKGDRTKSYKVLHEALDLFVDMGNQKALGVANNNLGTMVLEEQMEKSSSTASNKESYLAGIKYFDEAIRIGTFEYQNADWDDFRGEFVKQLANRYFNRGMFYVVNRHMADDAEAQGVKDLDRAKSLDQEAYLYTRERGQTVQQARSEFFCILRRARGMLKLIQESDFRDVWGIEDLIEQADDLIHNPAFSDSSLFENVNLVARKQQVQDLKIQYALTQGKTREAAEMAMKILVEDEYVIDTVLMNCVTTLNKYFDEQGEEPEHHLPNLAERLKRETRRGQVDSLRAAKNVIFCLDYSGSMAGERMERANANLLWVYEENCLDKDYVGFCRFNHAVDEQLHFGLQRKGGNSDEHLAIIGQALDAEGGTRLYAALNHCVSMALNSGNDYDSWIIALTDGESAWDFPAKQVISRIEKNNNKEGPKIHVIVIGFEVPPEVADSVAIITKITEKSMYIDAQGGLDEMDNAFERVASVITGTSITMETF